MITSNRSPNCHLLIDGFVNPDRLIDGFFKLDRLIDSLVNVDRLKWCGLMVDNIKNVKHRLTALLVACPCPACPCPCPCPLVAVQGEDWPWEWLWTDKDTSRNGLCYHRRRSVSSCCAYSNALICRSCTSWTPFVQSSNEYGSELLLYCTPTRIFQSACIHAMTTTCTQLAHSHPVL